MPRNEIALSWTPALMFGVVGLAQLAVLWFAAYRILSAAFLILFVVLLIVRRRNVARASEARPAWWSFVGVYLYMTLAVLWAPRPQDAAVEILTAFAVSVPPFVFGLALARRFDLVNIAHGMALLPFLFLLQAMYSFAAVDDPMLVGEFNLRTQLGGLLCLITPLLLAQYLATRHRFVLAAFGVALLLAVSIQSRSTLLIVTPALMFVLRAHNKKLFRLAAMTMVVAAVGAAAVISAGGSIGRFSAEDTSFDVSDAVVDELLLPDQEGVDLERRVHAFIASSLFLRSPIFGAGYSSVLQTFIDEVGIPVPSHGYVPGTMGELGVVGLGVIASFVWFTAKLVRTLYSTMPAKVRIVGHSYGVGFGSLVAFGFFHQTFEWAYFPMLVGLLLGAARIPTNALRKPT